MTGRSDTKMVALAPPLASPHQNISYFLDSPHRLKLNSHLLRFYYLQSIINTKTLLHMVMLLHFSNSTAHGHAIALQQLYYTWSSCCNTITLPHMAMHLHFSNSTVHGHAVALQQLYYTRSCCCTSATLPHTVMLLHISNCIVRHQIVAFQ